MADNVAITEGSGTNVATDQVTGTLEHVQLTKLAIATDGSRALIPADGTDGLLVNLGTNNDVTVSGTVTVGSHAVTNAGTFAVQVDGSALTALQLIDDPVIADDAAVTLSTSKANVVAGVAVNMDGTDPTGVSAEGDAAA